MAAPIVETIWLVNGFKRHIVMAVPHSVTIDRFRKLHLMRYESAEDCRVGCAPRSDGAL